MAAWVKGDATDADTAIAAAAALLAAARAPVIAGLSAEVAAIRAAYALAGRIGASVDPSGADAIYAELGALGRAGALTTTPAETVGRADAVVLVGTAPWRAPILARLTGSKPVRGRAAGAERRLYALGDSRPEAALSVATEAGGALAHLRACVRGHMDDGSTAADLARRLCDASYVALLYDPAELGAGGVEMVQGLAIDLSERTRCFTLAVGEAGRAAVPVAAWTTGQPPRTGFGRGVPEHDPWRFDAARQVAAGEADAALWLASTPAPRPDWLGTLPAIALTSEPAPDAAEVVIAVARPGEGRGGVLWNEARGALAYSPAAAPAPDGPPSAASVLARLAAHLANADLANPDLANRSEPAC